MKKTINKTTNWLTSSYTKEELLIRKTLAIVAAEIQLKRIDMGLDQKQFAKLLGVSQGMVSRWESGEYNFTIATLVNICEKLGVFFKPQMTTKETVEIAMQKDSFVEFNFRDCGENSYSNWIPGMIPVRKKEKSGVFA